MELRSNNGSKGTRAAGQDCWSTIGVRGDLTCAELKRHIHCRNCPTYASAAITLLDRDLPASYRAEWASHFAEGKQTKELESQSAIVFRMGEEWLALPTSVVDEVAEFRSIHSLPHRRNSVMLGLSNVRGELLICMSLAKIIGLENIGTKEGKKESNAKQRLIVVRHDGRRIAFPVDEIEVIHRYDPNKLKPVPATVAKAAATYTKAMLPWRDRTIGCLDQLLIVHALNRNIA
jgi:chemotaxis-related protein WspD